jgi:serine protease AprX
MAAWRWFTAIAMAAAVAVMMAASLTGGAGGLLPAAGATRAAVTPQLQQLAKKDPHRAVDVIVQLQPGMSLGSGRTLMATVGGTNLRDVRLINAVAGHVTAGAAWRLSSLAGVRAISLDAPVKSTGMVPDNNNLKTSYGESVRAHKAWAAGYTGKGIGVAVIDTGIAGDLIDFAAGSSGSGSGGQSRVVANAVVNPLAQGAGDTYGHGTHVAGLIAGNGMARQSGDPLFGKYAGVAPEANLIGIKADDGHGGTTVLDVIDGLQFATDFKDTYNIRVVNLSLRSSIAESYKTDPLDAAVEAAWFKGIVVVVAAGNDGTASDAVDYAPGNDPFVISVGGVDDNGTKRVDDDRLATWSSRGTTQDGFNKPDILAPGAHLISNLAPGADFKDLCPSCITDGEYFKVGGTSMAAGVVSGAVATILQAQPTWTPNQVKGTLMKRSRPVHSPRPETGPPDLVDADDLHPAEALTIESMIDGGEVAIDKVLNGNPPKTANAGITPNTLVNPANGDIDYSRASWSRASWSAAADTMRASWSSASWSRASWSRASWSATPESCSDFERASWSRASWSSADIDEAKRQCASVDTTRASWSRASWSRASWSASFEK